MSNALFLGIWEAADGEEFVLGANSFGLWEGVIRTCPGLHRLFVVSPKVALVLRQNKMGPEFVHDINVHITLTSKLIDVPMSRATLTYANYQDPPGAIILTTKRRQLEHCGNIGRPQKHRKTFSPTKLTQKQTRALNHVILIHLLNGGLTFSSPSAVRKTIQYHLQSDIPYARESKYLFRNLLGLLSEKALSIVPILQCHSLYLALQSTLSSIELPVGPSSSVRTMTGLTGFTISPQTTSRSTTNRLRRYIR